MQVINVYKEDFFITTDAAKIDVAAVHQYLSTQSYWAKNIPYSIVEKSVRHSLCFALFHKDRLIGFARIVSDFATIAYLGDVFIIAEYRKQGLSKWLMEQVMRHPELQGLRRWILLTSDAHELYAQFGWKPAAKPELYMEMHNPAAYKTGQIDHKK